MGGACCAWRPRATRAGLLGAALTLWACAGPLSEVDGDFTHTRHGYRIGSPPAATPPWRRVSFDGAVLAYRRPGPIWMTLSSRCRLPLTEPRILARHLRIGLPEHTLRLAEAVETRGLRGWQQIFDTREKDEIVRVKSVTFVVKRCALDWLLSARGGEGFERAEVDFDAWWRTLRVLPDTEPGGAP